jgi:hypothetical protein
MVYYFPFHFEEVHGIWSSAIGAVSPWIAESRRSIRWKVSPQRWTRVVRIVGSTEGRLFCPPRLCGDPARVNRIPAVASVTERARRRRHKGGLLDFGRGNRFCRVCEKVGLGNSSDSPYKLEIVEASLVRDCVRHHRNGNLGAFDRYTVGVPHHESLLF